MANPEWENYCPSEETYDSAEDTYKHKTEVSKLIYIVVEELLSRSASHDNSKLKDPEKKIFDIYTPKLKNTTYGSDEYNQYLKEMSVALNYNYHYSHNTHHPEGFKDGINGMSLLDILEMLLDWISASKRHADGSIAKSIEINQKRFSYSDELKQILINTVGDLGLMDNPLVK